MVGLYRPRTLVLAYHHVCRLGQTAPWITVSPERFAQQMAYLSEQGLTVSLDVLLDDLRKRRVPRGARVVVTFDDAAADTWEVAFPILRQHAVPTVLFVPTGLVGRPQPFWWDRLYQLSTRAQARGIACHHPPQEGGSRGNDIACACPVDVRPWQEVRWLPESQREEYLGRLAEAVGDDWSGQGTMRAEELAALDRSGLVAFGAHSVSHPLLADLDDAELAREVTESRDALAGYASFRRVFAYPYGDKPVVTERVKQAVREAGFEVAFSTEEAALSGGEDPMALGRVCVDDMVFDEFRWMIDHWLCR
jgi:peptidoglycan/xylan/chitin deacetylase (PgdA/CDA1 family)